MTTDLHFMSINELGRHVRSRRVSSREVTQAQLDRIANLDGKLASYACVTPEDAIRDAELADSETAAGQYRGPLHGIPIAIKDLCCTKGVPTAAGMAIYKDFRPQRDATVVARLRDQGAVLLGKLQMTEGAYSDHHPSVTPPKNPWNAGYWTGISSSGAAVATAAGLCYGAVASDTGGSIRWPSAANGLTGLMPTWGRVSRFGVFELAASLDRVGPIARSAADAALLLSVMAGVRRPRSDISRGSGPGLRRSRFRCAKPAHRYRSRLGLPGYRHIGPKGPHQCGGSDASTRRGDC